MKIILLNGCPFSGKTTSANIIQQYYRDTKIWGFSFHLKRFVHGIYLGNYGWNLPPDWFNEVKNEPQKLLGGKSWREMYIHHSEIAIKPVHGKQWFGNMFLNIIAQETNALTDAVIVPDSGFYDEALPLIEQYGAKNIILFNVYRKGTSFIGDSRSHIDLSAMGVYTVKIDNNGSIDNLTKRLTLVINSLNWLEHT